MICKENGGLHGEILLFLDSRQTADRLAWPSDPKAAEVRYGVLCKVDQQVLY